MKNFKKYYQKILNNFNKKKITEIDAEKKLEKLRKMNKNFFSKSVAECHKVSYNV